MDNQFGLPLKPADPVKRKSYSLDFKVNVIKEIESGKKTGDVGRVYSLAHSTVCSIWKDREKIMQAHNRNCPSMKRVRTPSREDIDLALFEWFKTIQSQNITVTNFNLMAKADEIADSIGGEKFKCTIGWLSRFKGRHDISFRKMSEKAALKKTETTSVDHDVSANLELELTTGEPESDPDMALVPAITMKEEPMSDPEDDAPCLGAPTSTTPSLTSVTSLAKFSDTSGSGEILGVPFGDLPTGPGSPPSMSPSFASEVGNSATNGRSELEKNRFLRSPTNESGEEAKLVSDYKRRDQFDVYGEYIASKLRRLDWRTCAHVQRAFGDIIFEAEMGKYR